MLFWLRQPLRDPAGDGNQGGGGAGAGAGSGSGSPGGLTPEAITKMITDGVNAALNGYDKKLQAKLKSLGGGQQPSSSSGGDDDDDPPPANTGKGGGNGGQDPEFTRLKKDHEKLKKQLADADAERAKEREQVKAEKLDAAIRRELAKFQFVDDEAFEAGYAAIARGVKYSEDGSMVGGPDDLPIGQYVGARMKKLDTLFKPKDVGGAGASNGGRQPSAGGDIDIDSIKPGMSAADLAKAKAHLAKLYSQQ